MTHSEVVRNSFVGQASAFEDANRHFKSSNVVQWLIENTPVEAGELVLEVAAGTGIFSRAIAGSAATVVAVDLTTEMLLAGKRSADALEIRNVVWQEGDVTRLPFLDDTFDRVITLLRCITSRTPPSCLKK